MNCARPMAPRLKRSNVHVNLKSRSALGRAVNKRKSVPFSYSFFGFCVEQPKLRYMTFTCSLVHLVLWTCLLQRLFFGRGQFSFFEQSFYLDTWEKLHFNTMYSQCRAESASRSVASMGVSSGAEITNSLFGMVLSRKLKFLSRDYSTLSKHFKGWTMDC